MSTSSIQSDFGDPFRPPKEEDKCEVDGACFSTSQQENEEEVYVKPLERVHKEYVYNTDRGQRGLVVIFNHSKFKTKVTTDSNFDIIAKTKQTWEQLNFEVCQYDDLSIAQITSEMEKVSFTSHKYACFVCIVKTQGKEDRLKANNGWYNADKLWKPFLDKEKCKWHGKPRIFILEAPRGTKVDMGIPCFQRDFPDAIKYYRGEQSGPRSYGIPVHADFLFVYSTFYGIMLSYSHVSYDDENGVPIFLKELNDVIERHANDLDFESMLSIVKYKLAHYLPNDTSETYKQMPCTFSTLTKILYFTSLDDFVLTESEMDSIDAIRQKDGNEQQLYVSEHPTITIEGTLSGFNAKRITITHNFINSSYE